MATPEVIYHLQPPEIVGKRHETLNEIVDPLELAVQAVAKLRHNGLPSFIEAIPLEIPAQEDKLAEVIIHPSSKQLVKERSVLPLGEETGSPTDKYNARISSDTVQRLVIRAKQGDKAAMDEIWLDAYRLAGRVSRVANTVLSEEEIIQVGMLQVPGAVERYDHTKKASFRTFLHRRLLGAIQDEQRSYASSVGVSRRDYKQLQNALKSEDPNAFLHDLTKKGFVGAADYIVNGEIVATPPSLDTSMVLTEGEGQIPRVNLLEGDTDVFEEATKSIESEEVEKVLNNLSEREQYVLTHYYGLRGKTPLTLREIGGLMGVTESRISQIKARAVDQLAILWPKTAYAG